MELPAATFPGEQPVTRAELLTFLQSEEYVTEQRMRRRDEREGTDR